MNEKAKGGKSVYGSAVGILVLQARFPRIVGDVGNAETWPFAVHYKVIDGASPDRVVRHRAEGLLDAFIDGAHELVAMGADGVTTTCGFLSPFQNDISAAVGVPVATSSLMQYGAVQALLPPGKRVGILTISKASLSAEHLSAAGVPLDAPVVGMDEQPGEFVRAILGDEPELDVIAAERDLLKAATALVRSCPETGAILLECTNMCRFSAAIAEATGLPVFDMVGFVTWFQGALRPRQY